MTQFLQKGYKKRLSVRDFEIKKQIIRSLMFNCYISSLVRRKLNWQYGRLCFLTSFVYHKNVCVFTGRVRSIYNFFNLSRLSIKEFLKLKLIPGLSKSSW